VPAGEAVCGWSMEERTPPVRRPARREARLFEFAVVIAFVVNGGTEGRKDEQKVRRKEY
jgi:hypothetical protein